MKNQKGFIVPLLVAIIAILVIGGGIYIYKNKKAEVPIAQTETTQNTDSQTANLKTYTNTQYGFEIKYPADFTIHEDHEGGFFDEQNLFNVSISASASYQKNTDFNLGRVDISASPSTLKCYTSSPNGQNLSLTKLINGITFYYPPGQPMRDDAMGGQRGWDSLFANIHSSQCFRIEKLVGYRDTHGFAEPPYPPHFDEQKVNADLDATISTFKFTK